MLFVGADILGSKANLAGASYDYLARASTSINSCRYLVDKRVIFLPIFI
jgi:hypothetical protein